MNKLFRLVCLLALVVLVSCQEKAKEVPEWTGGSVTTEKPDVVAKDMYPWESDRTRILEYSDMVLAYGGGHNRNPYLWDTNRCREYLDYLSPKGIHNWLFDSFLFLELTDQGEGGSNHTFASGYSNDKGLALDSADKNDWQNLINYYFAKDNAVDALDKAVEMVSSFMGKPNRKIGVVLTIPEPIATKNWRKGKAVTSKYWGDLDGKRLDFSKDLDKYKACKWFIDQCRKKFNDGNFKNVELAGFYWLPETSEHSESLMPIIGTYLNNLHYSFNWIPFFKAGGFSQWKRYKVSTAYLQPNYFFNDATPISRLDEACELADKFNMNMEIEFDGNALAANGRGHKLREYMTYYKKHGVWAKRRLAYYVGSDAFVWLKHSNNPKDKELYNEFCEWVVSRPMRDI